VYASAKRIAGSPDSGAPERFAFRAVAASAIATATTASIADRDPPDGVVGRPGEGGDHGADAHASRPSPAPP
jgi:hypothetical protein